ncbi:hypothetical protein SASPL_131145 [Salvia splendens]|uniref:TPX2 C-terminal domain-containing protein n=1 Tax=Salvia splendens TaxID=180675 RepID=A0A8X8X878_SALSN|nr:hypothetical protein SASPL_131145 [Salvia splendens]
MDSSSKSGGAVTPAKGKTARSKLNESLRHSENVNPNVSIPSLMFSNSPFIIKSEKSAKKSAFGNPNPSPKQLIRERKFVIAKKRVRNQEQSSLGADAADCEKCKKAIGKSKCFCVAYESLRASHENFFKNRDETEDEVSDKLEEFDLMSQKEGVKLERKLEGDGSLSEINEENKTDADEFTENDDTVDVDLLSDDGLEPQPTSPETQVSSSSFCPSNFYLTSESLGLDLHRSYSFDSKDGSSISTITSAGAQKDRRSSTESAADRARRLWKRKQRKVTSPKPFILRTEERGRCKEEEFMKKLQQMIEEEKKMRVPIAQGLPWTTDEPECLVKPPVKEITRPADLVLHSDVRAVDRSEFDHQIAMKTNLIEQYQMERERQQKLEEEEEEIRRLRKELVPKAQPMPYFDRPFVTRRSGSLVTLKSKLKRHHSVLIRVRSEKNPTILKFG